jgi:hypothetical protein
VKLSNPVNTQTHIDNLWSKFTYKAEFNDEELSGPSELTVPSKSELVYPLVYSPMRSAGTRKTKISFRNSVICEFSYEITLEAAEAEPVKLKMMKCPLNSYAVRRFICRLTIDTTI